MSADDERLVHGRGDPWDCGVCNPTGLSRSAWTAAERAKQRADVAALTAPSPSTDTAGDPTYCSDPSCRITFVHLAHGGAPK